MKAVVESLYIGRKVKELVKSEKRIIVFFDGASRGNPGHAGVGAIVFEERKIFSILSKYIGIATNNIAEYRALNEILMKIEPLVKEKKEVEILLKSDSQLLTRQLTGIYKIKNPQLKKLSITVMKILRRYKRWRIEHISRIENKIADWLATSAVDNALRALQSK